MRGRTALDHAHRQTAQVRDWLRGRGFVSGKEIAREAQGLAQSLLAAETQKEQMEKLRDLLPSEEVLRRARLRQKMRGGRPSLSQDSTPFAVSHLQVWPPGRSPLPSPTSEAPGASCLSRSPQETRGGPKARDGRHVQLTLPEQAVRGSLERLF
ncbi:unnamed protein product [Polarella glacialis]|uniref:Uncharacterized protein n=1 Tax=Polarella glacialis TaxID=89957 RepID=A0A813DX69_POLGL|nr:unnamed protein product [Polarella glacialis]